MFEWIAKGFKAVAVGNAQAKLGMQSPHLPSMLVRVGRFLYASTGAFIAVAWYTGYVNMRTPPGSGPTLVLPGKPIIGGPSRANPTPSYPGASGIGGGSNTPGGPNSGLPTALPGSGKAGGFLPRGAKYNPGRADQGRDGSTDPGGPIIAPGPGFVITNLSDPNGFGPHYPVVHFTGGPYAGKDIYIGHTISQVNPGQRFNAGQILSYTGGTRYPMPIGNATVPGWFEIGFAPGGSPGAFGQPTPF